MALIRSLVSRLFDIFNYILLGTISLTAVLPFVYVIVASFTPPEILAKNQFILIPKEISFEAYEYIFSTSTITRALLVSISITIIGTFFNIIMTVLMAYPLAYKPLKGRKILLFMITFTMMFSGGIIPSYMVIQKLGLMNSYAALILPSSISAFNLIIFKNFFQGLPNELSESAKIDGCNDLFILFRIILPISLPLIATFVIMYGVAHWNSWFGAVLYMNDSKKWPIQVVLRQIITSASGIGDSESTEMGIIVPPQSVRMCTITIATVPILCIYPFLQKYFTKGLMIGSVKG
ncbi:carbohydrate ABC transporter permease [Vallitalea okinawensis]|uniref:carbohydrate ABC transporter permease n=1 Tax=Vallitalea okinawensis TaxID=2078660 RepID=UPI000CFB59B8|nr:carbohydrate ABC transporter permease [Vallitalea okinawensis]